MLVYVDDVDVLEALAYPLTTTSTGLFSVFPGTRISDLNLNQYAIKRVRENISRIKRLKDSKHTYRQHPFEYNPVQATKKCLRSFGSVQRRQSN